MKIKSLISSCFFVFLNINSFGQSFQWATKMGGSEWDEGTSIKTDQNNNVYVIGLFIGTVDFDPSNNVFNLTSVGEKDVFISKFDTSGNFLWAKQYGADAAIDEECALEIDAQGNLYITNSFLGTADFDPGPDTFTLTSQGVDRDIYIQKLDANGNFLWAKQMGAQFNFSFPTPAHSNAIALDTFGNVYITGYFDGTVDFDPHPTLTFNLTSQFNASDAFVCKLDTNGNFVWAKQFTGTLGLGGVGYSIALDDNGNVYSTGTFDGSVDFDPGPNTFFLTRTVPFQSEIYVSKLDASGNFAWARALGPGEGHTITTFGTNAVYSSGWTPLGFIPAINKLDANGTLLWTKQLVSNNSNSLAVDTNGNVYFSGHCFGTNDFDPGPGVFNLSGGESDTYISKLDSSGNFIWAGLLTGTNQVWSKSMTLDTNNNIYTTGFFNGTADFDPSNSVFNLTSPEIGYDIFISKLRENEILGVEQNSFNENIKLYPNPTKGILNIQFDKAHDGLTVVLRNMLGQQLYSEYTQKKNQIELQIDGENGVYFVEFSDNKNQKTIYKVIKK